MNISHTAIQWESGKFKPYEKKQQQQKAVSRQRRTNNIFWRRKKRRWRKAFFMLSRLLLTKLPASRSKNNNGAQLKSKQNQRNKTINGNKNNSWAYVEAECTPHITKTTVKKTFRNKLPLDAFFAFRLKVADTHRGKTRFSV